MPLLLDLRRTLRCAAVALAAFASGASAQTTPTPDYVGSETCTACHLDEAEAWSTSHHAKAWTPPTADNILGDFDNASFEHKGVTSRFYRDGDTFMIETDGPDDKMTKYPVAGVIGITPLQQYILETEPGKFQSFDVVWDTEKRQWYHLYPDQDLTAFNALHWTGPYKNWNARCAECHATGFEKNFNPTTKSYASTQSEIGVGCESCHGPGSAHNALAKDGFETLLAPQGGLSSYGFTVDLALGGETLIQQCAGCHSRREPFEDGNPLPGTPFHDAYRLSTLRTNLYHPDGQILDEVYVYGSFVQSKMYEKGVTCSNCHNAHTAGLEAEGNAVCTQCHSEAGNPDFASLPLKTYDDPSHHFHTPDTDAAQCKSCHMIERDYMGVDGRRDHSFRVPRPDLSIATRAPNACNDCHKDKTARWANEAVEIWYPQSTHRGPHFSTGIAAARTDLRNNTDTLIGIAEHADLPGVVRATALEMLAPAATPAIAARLEPLLNDPDPMVRANAIAVQRGAPETDRSVRLVGMLADPVKAVRISAARNFLGMRIARMPDRMTRDLQNANSEWQQSLLAKADFPETQMVLAGIGLTTRNMQAALGAFGDAVTLDPQLTQAWVMIVRIHAALNDREKAMETIDAAIAANPDSVELSLMRVDLMQ